MDTKETSNPLGIDMTSLGKIKAKDLINNKPLANTVLNYIRSLEKDRAELETSVETYRTYIDDYNITKFKNKVAAGLNIFGTIFVGFGVNFATNGNNAMASFFLVPGVIALIISGIFLIK